MQVSHRNYDFLLGISLKDVVEYIKKAVDITYEGNSIPVFTQKSVTEMYNERLIHHGCQKDSINAVAFAQTPMQLECGKKYRIKSRVFVLQRKV